MLYSVTGSPADTVGKLNSLRYRGYCYDQDTGMYYLQSRYYDPEIRRFINADTYVDTGVGVLGTNMFIYCNNNAVMGYDPTGEWDVKDHEKLCLNSGCAKDSRFIVWDKYADQRYMSCKEYSAPFHGRTEPQVLNIIKELYNLFLPLKGKNDKQKTKFSYSKSGKGYTKLSGNLKFSVRNNDMHDASNQKAADKMCNQFLNQLNSLPTGDAQSRALLGLALHTAQDYFAHSVQVLVTGKNGLYYNNRMTNVNASLKSKYGITTKEFEDNKQLLPWRYKAAQSITDSLYKNYLKKKKIKSISTYREAKMPNNQSYSFKLKKNKLDLNLSSNLTSMIVVFY